MIPTQLQTAVGLATNAEGAISRQIDRTGL